MYCLGNVPEFGYIIRYNQCIFNQWYILWIYPPSSSQHMDPKPNLHESDWNPGRRVDPIYTHTNMVPI